MRATNGASRHRMIKRLLKRAKGYVGGRHRMYRVACEAVRRSEAHAFVGRKLKKREFRRLWIKRLTIGLAGSGISYSRFVHALQKLDVRLDRKQLSELAIHEPQAFKALVERAKAAVS